MLIHFAFGNFKQNIQEQINLTIDYILQPRKLRFSHECYEFLPTLHYPTPNGYALNIRAFKLIDNQFISPKIKLPFSDNENKDFLIPMNTRRVTYFPKMIPMICFIRIPFNKLGNSTHHLHYGKLGLVFGKNFIKKYHPRQVIYYKEEDLFRDEKILQYNKLINTSPRTPDREKQLMSVKQEILLYRKPHMLWPSFSESVIARVSNRKPELKCQLQLWQYDRYPCGYDFSKEQEWRIATNPGKADKYVDFDDSDIEAIIVPDEYSKKQFFEYLKRNYKSSIKLILFPS